MATEKSKAARWPGRVTSSAPVAHAGDGDEQVQVTIAFSTGQLGVPDVGLTASRLRGRAVVLVVEGGRPVGLELVPRQSALEQALAAQAVAAEEERQVIERAARRPTRLAAELAALAGKDGG